MTTLSPAERTRRIERIDRILASGASSTSVDGISTSLDHDSLRDERRRLLDEEDREAGLRRKPVVSTLNLRRAFGP